ncbi:MAG TPA: GTPase HflX [Candidatus Brocadiia bacterium]|nr:GTPase HflX [Candidatus Brocadiia bacterium]
MLVGALPHDAQDVEDEMEELASLATSAGAFVVGRMLQRLHAPAAATYLGAGKLDELRQLCAENRAHTVIFNVDLSPAQVRNIEKAIDRKVIDRSELILDIFAARARSTEARLEVELAQFEYTYPRLRRMWSHLDSVAGGTAGGIGGGIGTRGPGERQLETDRRLVRKRIRDLKRELDEVGERRRREVASRADEVTACLVGYTNAGKSTLMNALTQAGVYAADQLFATLDTRTRICEAGEGARLLLSDTVGFIRRLPHHLVASFRATLEEARQADLLVHVVDASARNAEEQIAAVRQVLNELDLAGRPETIVLNKIDLVTDPDRLVQLRQAHPQHVCVSAVTGQGIDDLRAAMRRFIFSESSVLTVRFPPANGKLQVFLERNSEIVERKYGDEVFEVTARVPHRCLGRLRALGGQVESNDPLVAAPIEG